jgi:stage II sporulation protein D
MLRPAVALLALLAALAATSAATARAGVDAPLANPTFAISGRGWGHGVGMSQYGAYGFALRGVGYQQIVAHYYRGTTLGKAPVARVRVLLVEGRKTLTVSADSPFRLRDGAGVLHQLEPGRYAFGPGLRLALEPGALTQLPGPLLFSSESTPLAVNGKRYRGSLEVGVESGRLRAINAVGLQAYLYGVVPDEVPHTWPEEALKAQAVVARSYALAVRKSGPFDLYADVRSQVYGGVDSEEPTTTAAVNATAGQVVMYAGKVATTYFFSTSGGRTANVADVWSGTPIPYLVAVPDPYDTASPHHRWGPVAFTATQVRKALALPGRVADVRTTVIGSGRVGSFVAVGDGVETSVPATEVRRRLGLRSTWFRVGVLALEPLAKPVVYGGRARLAGSVRGLANVTLEQRAGTAAWETAGELKPGADGRFALAVKPLSTVDYRLASGTVRGTPVRVGVAPLVRLAQPTDAVALRGTVKPQLPGASVAVQRLEGTIWREVGRGTVDAQGGFAAQLQLVPAAYRARIAPGRGFVAGLSPVLDVVLR